MSMSYPQQPVGQPAVPAQPAYQGTAPGYAPVPQGPVVQKVNRASIILGVVGWALIGLTILAMWLAIRASASDPDPSGKEAIGFLPLFALMFIGPVNLAGGVIGIVGAVGKPKTRKLNWLGILLNASPYVVFTAFMIVLMLFM
ncbi:cell division protein FtsW [Schaalia odontolytica]|nr:cell division protein FtsW [Schaalia odontolytica]